jgi:hypothetical protein
VLLTTRGTFSAFALDLLHWNLFVTGPIALGLLHWAGMSLGSDRVRQVRNPGTRKHRDPNGHNEVHRVADHVTVVQPSAVLPGNASGLSACLRGRPDMPAAPLSALRSAAARAR